MYAARRNCHLPNQFIVDLSAMVWTNPNNIIGVFSQAMLFEAFCHALYNTIGKSDYDYGSLLEWVDSELGCMGNPDSETLPLVNDVTFIQIMQSTIITAFCEFVINNRAYLAGAVIPILQAAEHVAMVTQDDNTGVVRIQYV